jgi:hypothetical protein
MWGVPGGATTVASDPFFHLLSSIICYLSPEAEGFIFISGLSITLSYRTKLYSLKNNFKFKGSSKHQQLCLKYFLQSFFIFLIGFFYYNFRAYLSRGYVGNLWSWNIFWTLSFSISFILLIIKYSKKTKILISSLFLLTYGLFFTLIPSDILTSPGDQILIKKFSDIFFYIFYNGFSFTPLLGFFPFFLLGNVLGEIIYEKTINEETKISNKNFFRSILIPLILMGVVIVIISLFITPLIGFVKNSFNWLFYSLGSNLILFLLLLYIEKKEVIKIERNFKFFFYFSYYSLTIFIIHEFLFPFLFQKFTVAQGFFISLIIILGFYIFLLIIYKKLGKYFSLKWGVSELATRLTDTILTKHNKINTKD